MLTITNKKSQMEIIGLVIIVILISLALIFFLRFSMNKTATEKRTYTSAQLTSNMINTLAKTTTPCAGKTITELYIECANLNPVDCNGDGFDESDACEIANSTVTELLAKTLVGWQKKFKFQVFIPEDTILYSADNSFVSCSGNIKTEAYPVPLMEQGGLFYLRLNICED